MSKIDDLVLALKAGKQITNGPQSIVFDVTLNRGYICCDTPGCCDGTYDSLEEIMEFIDEEWEAVNDD